MAELPAIHHRHGEVKENESRQGGIAQASQRLGTIGGAGDRVAFAFQESGHGIAECRIIIDVTPPAGRPAQAIAETFSKP
jgi:hypothetical protein